MTTDANTPLQVAAIVEAASIARVKESTLNLLVLGVLAGAYIAFGGLYAALVLTESGLGFGITRLLAGLAFSIGLVLVVIGGAQLFTGNNLIVMAWAEHDVSTWQLLRNWLLVYIANFVGALAVAAAAAAAGVFALAGGAFGQTVVAIAEAKAALGFGEALLRGVLANVLVCLAIWIATAAHTVSGKIIAIALPISAFVALGFEHSVANMFLIPLGMLAGADVGIGGVAGNLVPVTLGNVIGGAGLVAMAYWTVYLRHREAT